MLDDIKRPRENRPQEQEAAEKLEKQEAFDALYNNKEEANVASWGLSRKTFVIGLAAIVVIAVGVFGVENGWLGVGRGLVEDGKGLGEVKEVKGVEVVDGGAWYAVHLADGKVYYGHLKKLESDYPELTEVFYTRDEAETATSTGMGDKLPSGEFVGEIRGSKITLVKLGTESHRPEDKIVINKQNLLFYEKLSEDSPIVRAIENYLSGR